MRRRLLLPALAALLVGGDPADAGALVVVDVLMPSTLNPLYARTMSDVRAQSLIFDRLFYRTPIHGGLVSRLVEDAATLDGGQAIRLTIKEGIRWHDGEPFGADDVCFTVGALLNPGNPIPPNPYTDALASCEAVSEREAVVRFRKPYHSPHEMLSFLVMPAHRFQGTTVSPDDDFSVNPIGTGPMKATKTRRAVRFEAFPNTHHDAKIPAMILREAGDPFVETRLLLRGEPHGLISVPAQFWPEMKASPDVSLKSYDLRTWWFVALNTNEGVLKDKRVRQALNLLIDRTKLQELTIGVDPTDENPPCEFISGPFVRSSPYYNRQIKPIEHDDPEAARRLLESAGFVRVGGRWTLDGAPVGFKIGSLAPYNQDMMSLSLHVAEQLRAAGFEADDYGGRTLRSGDFDIAIASRSAGLVEDVGPLFHTREGGKGRSNVFDYSSPEADALLDRFSAARTDTEAKDANYDLHRFLANDLPYLFLWKLDTKTAWRNEVRNNTISPYDHFAEFDAWTFTPQP